PPARRPPALHDRRDRPRGRDRQAPRQALGRRTRTLPPRRRRSPRPLAPPGRLTHPHSAAPQGRAEPPTEHQPRHWTGYVTLSGARGTAHRATTPRTRQETSTLQGRGEPRSEEHTSELQSRENLV